jgi:hypothetical protein
MQHLLAHVVEVGLLLARDGGVCSPAGHCPQFRIEAKMQKNGISLKSSEVQIKCVSLLLEWTISFQVLNI